MDLGPALLVVIHLPSGMMIQLWILVDECEVQWDGEVQEGKIGLV